MGDTILGEKTRYFADLKAILASIYGIIVCGFLNFCWNANRELFYPKIYIQTL